MEIIETREQESSGLYITPEIKKDLHAAAKWANFLAIISYVGVGLMVVGGFCIMIVGIVNPYDFYEYGGYYDYGGTMDPLIAEQPFIMGVIYTGAAVLYFFPALYMQRFSSKVRHAVSTDQQISLNEGISYLRKLYKFMGMAVIITIGDCIVFIFFAMTAAMVSLI